MSKYIDADPLRKEIDHRIDILEDMSIKCAKNDDTEMHAYYHGKAVSLQELLSFIDSFQQEQPLLSDLDEASEKWCEENNKGIALCDDKKSHYLADGIDAFKAGAEWAMQHKV